MPIPSLLGRFQRRFQRWLGLCLGLLFVAVGLCLSGVASPTRLPSEVIVVPRGPDQTLIGRLYVPPEAIAPYPTLMLWHGVNCTKETMEPLAVELARHGVAAFTVDAGGFGESYDRPFSDEENLADARAIAAYVFDHPERFDADRIGVGGHSMGGATALSLAMEDSRIKTTVVLGMSMDITPVTPPNLFLGIGLYEEFHTPDAMRLMLAQGLPAAEADAVQMAQQYGDFSRGTARQLVISPTADHMIEPFDPTLLRAAVDWAGPSLVLPTFTPRLLQMPAFIVGWFLVLLGSFISAGCGLRHFRLAQKHPRWLLGGVAIAALFVLLLGMAHRLAGRTATELILLAAVTLPVGAYALRYPADVPSTLRKMGLYLGLMVLAYSTVAVLVRGDELWHHPAFLLGLPQFIVQIPIALLYSRIYDFRGTMFPVYSEGLVPSVFLVLLFLPELVVPGGGMRSMTQVADWVLLWLRQPFEIRWIDRPSSKSLQLFGVLVVVLLGVLYQQSKAGVLSREHLWLALHLSVQMVVLPVGLLVVMIRTPLIQKAEAFCQDPSAKRPPA